MSLIRTPRQWPWKAGITPRAGWTMIGIKRLDQLQECAETVLRRGVPGDFIEAGAWRGGATIFMRGVLKAHNVTDRTVWVADSFEGLPPPDPKYAADAGSTGISRPPCA